MIKLICFVKRKEGMTPEAFHEHWRNVHGPLIASTRSGARCVRYEQHHRPLDDYDRPFASDHDGVTIQWFDDVGEFEASVAEPDYVEIHADIERFIDMSKLVWILTDEPEVVFDRT